MRLLKYNSTAGLSLTENRVDEEQIPPYAILSHTWQHGKEVIFDDFKEGTIGKPGQNKVGYDKILFCARQAQRDGLHHVWVDTCCINKNDGVELQHAINSMFRWYKAAAQCYVYLWDVSTSDERSGLDWEIDLRQSLWFTRGWVIQPQTLQTPPIYFTNATDSLQTLQELLAPREVKFFSREGKQLGDRQSLERQIQVITGIASAALRATPLNNFSVEERLSWMEGRNTTYEEDKVYSLLGMFGVYMSPIYGEGKEYAMRRLLREIDASTRDSLRQQALHRASNTNKDTLAEAAQRLQAPFLVPFQRAQSFTGREAQLDCLRTHISSEDRLRLAIYGLGGSGKTALALECISWTRELQPTRAIFWIPAINRESFEQAYYEIAKLLQIPGIEDGNVDIKELVRAKLSDELAGPWLIVVDNADTTSVLIGNMSDGNTRTQLMDYLPQSRKGSIIFTTRTREIAVRLAGSNIIALGKLEETEATELLRKRLAPEHHHQLKDHDTVDKILVMLFFHALAIVQAIAFINRNDITLHDYIALYESSEGDAVDLLNEDFRDHTRYREATNAVSRTWYISFEQIQKQDSIAAQHLFFMACTASNDIRAFMFPPDYTKTEHIKAIGTLKAYAFITERAIQVDGPRNYSQTYKQFDVHPLVHLAIRAWLKARLQWTVWLEKTLTRLLAITPWETYDDRDYWKTYLNHGIHVANLPEVKDKVDRVRLLDRLGSCEAELGRYQAAEQSFRQAYEQGRMMLGEEDIHTLMIKGRMGKAISLQGRWADAENIHRDVLTLVRPVAGERSEHTLFCRVNLAFDTLGQRKLVEAEEMFRQCLPLLREVLGESHLRTLGAMHNLGTLLGSQGKLEDAVRILRETFALLSETLGGEDASTLSTQSALATTLHYQQKHSQAELIHRQVLATRKRVLGDEHPDTVLSMSELGLALSGQHTDPAKLLEAEQLHREALALSFQHTGNSSRATLKQKSRLADTLRWQLKYEESEKLHREVLASRENVLGMDDPDTVGSVYGLAALAHDQMQYDDAMRLYERAYVGFMARYGAEHSVTKTCSDELTWVRRVVEEDRVAEAAKMQQGHGDDAFSEPMQALGVEGAARPIQKGWRKRLGHLIKKS